MNWLSSSEFLDDIQQRARGFLTDTFEKMFKLDVALLPETGSRAEGRMLGSHMELSDKTTQSILSIAISYDLLESLGKDLVSEDSPPLPELVQDILYEVNNIVGNRLRSYIHDTKGVDLAMSLPHAGVPPKGADNIAVINLHFRIRDKDQLNLGLNSRRLATH